MQIAFLGSKPVFRSADEIRHSRFLKQVAGEVVATMLNSMVSKCVVPKISLDLHNSGRHSFQTDSCAGVLCERHKMTLSLVGFMTNGG